MHARRVLAALVLTAIAGCAAGPAEHPRVEAEGGRVRLPLSQVGDGGVHFFTYVSEGGRRVGFLVRTDRDGGVRAHLDACFSCYRYRRGFVVEGSDVVCRACRYTYPLAEPVWELQGACAPIPVSSRLAGDELVIEREVLERAARFF